MSVDELMTEATDLRAALSRDAERLQTIYTLVYSKVRRSPADETTSSYINVANAGRRFSGMVLQASRRTANFDRILAAAKEREAESVKERQETEAAEKLAAEKKAAEKKASNDRRARLLGEGYPMTSEDDLIELYGEGY